MVNVRGREEQVRLKPMSIEDQPSTEDFKTAVTSMSTYSDWCNLLPLLCGMKDSKRGLQAHRLEWVIRKACEAGKHGVILECAKQSARTGLELREVEVVRTLFQGFHDAAHKSNFGRATVERSLKQAKQATSLIGLPNKKGVSIKEDATRQPDIIGVLLELSASHALQASEGKDEDGEVASYARRTLDTWPVGDFDLKEPTKWSTANEKLKQMVPLWHGMKLAMKVKEVKTDNQLRTNLQKQMDQLGRNIEAAMKIVSEGDRSYIPKSLTMSQELYKK